MHRGLNRQLIAKVHAKRVTKRDPMHFARHDPIERPHLSVQPLNDLDRRWRGRDIDLNDVP